jgi:hypothetical protein
MQHQPSCEHARRKEANGSGRWHFGTTAATATTTSSAMPPTAVIAATTTTTITIATGVGWYAHEHRRGRKGR